MAEVVPRPAATVILMRDDGAGIQVLMMKRNMNSAFVPGAYVFPGGSVDVDDASEAARVSCSGCTDEEASRRMGIAEGGLAYWHAAIREAFEEAGLLFAYDGTGRMVTMSDSEVERRFKQHRDALNRRERAFSDILREEQLTLAADQLVYHSHWITPARSPRRYDTRFFVAMAPEHQEPVHDNEEVIDHEWVRPGEALERHEQGNFQMRLPTVTTLKEFARYGSARAAVDAIRAKKDIPRTLPIITASGERYVPGDPGYEELARNTQ